jgi:hypothetical protein
MMVAISKQDTHSNGQTNQLHFIQSMQPSAALPQIHPLVPFTPFSSRLFTSEIMMNAFARNQYEKNE